MKKLLTSILTAFTILMSFQTAYAEEISNSTIDLSYLTPEQIESIKSQINSADPINTLEIVTNKGQKTIENINNVVKGIDYNKFYENGSKAGQTLLGFTRELGVAGADLLKSWTGALIIIAAFCYYFGSNICLFLSGIILLYMGYKILIKMFSFEERVIDKQRIKDNETITTYKTVRTLHFRTSKKLNEDNSDATFAFLASSVILAIPGIVFLSLSLT